MTAALEAGSSRWPSSNAQPTVTANEFAKPSFASWLLRAIFALRLARLGGCSRSLFSTFVGSNLREIRPYLGLISDRFINFDIGRDAIEARINKALGET